MLGTAEAAKRSWRADIVAARPGSERASRARALTARSERQVSRYASTPRDEAARAERHAGGRLADSLLDAIVEAGVERVDEGIAIVEVHVEGPLGDARLGDDPIDAEAGEPMLLGDRDAGVEQGLAGSAPAAVGASAGIPIRVADGHDHLVTRHDRPVSHLLGSGRWRRWKPRPGRSPTTSAAREIRSSCSAAAPTTVTTSTICATSSPPASAPSHPTGRPTASRPPAALQPRRCASPTSPRNSSRRWPPAAPWSSATRSAASPPGAWRSAVPISSRAWCSSTAAASAAGRHRCGPFAR